MPLLVFAMDLSSDVSVQADYETTLAELQTAVEEQAGALLLDQSPMVRRSALANIAKLCLFFGRSKTNDILLSRMITYLNDRDWRLRHAFLENIVSVAALVGSTSLEEFVLPLMEQALAGKLQRLGNLPQLTLALRSRGSSRRPGVAIPWQPHRTRFVLKSSLVGADLECVWLSLPSKPMDTPR